METNNLEEQYPLLSWHWGYRYPGSPVWHRQGAQVFQVLFTRWLWSVGRCAAAAASPGCAVPNRTIGDHAGFTGKGVQMTAEGGR